MFLILRLSDHLELGGVCREPVFDLFGSTQVRFHFVPVTTALACQRGVDVFLRPGSEQAVEPAVMDNVHQLPQAGLELNACGVGTLASISFSS